MLSFCFVLFSMRVVILTLDCSLSDCLGLLFFSWLLIVLDLLRALDYFAKLFTQWVVVLILFFHFCQDHFICIHILFFQFIIFASHPEAAGVFLTPRSIVRFGAPIHLSGTWRSGVPWPGAPNLNAVHQLTTLLFSINSPRPQFWLSLS